MLSASTGTVLVRSVVLLRFFMCNKTRMVFIKVVLLTGLEKVKQIVVD